MALPPLPGDGERISDSLVLNGIRRRTPLWLRPFQLAVLLGLGSAVASTAAAFVLYVKFSRDLPSIPTVRDYRPPLLS
jgi:hypothetical protein